MEIRTLSNIDLDELLAAFNEAFSDYHVPLQLTMDQLKGKIRADKTNFDYSVGAFIDGKLVGFILHGYDIIDHHRIVYNGGTGVIPSQRKHGLTKQMYDFILPYLRAANVDSLVLEVMTQNIQAIKSYEKVGYQVARKLICYRGEMNTMDNAEMMIEEMFEYNWENIRSFWDFSPSWQNSSNVLEELMNTNKSYGAFVNNQLIGYIVYNPVAKRVQQFAVDTRYRRKKIATTLFNHLSKVYDRNFTIINVDEGSQATNEFLLKIGLKNFVEQLEMKLQLNPNQAIEIP
jgi:ribosomal protein S18 acetylase RimI-like enzyme